MLLQTTGDPNDDRSGVTMMRIFSDLFTVADLRKHCRKLNLSTVGRKADIIKRIINKFMQVDDDAASAECSESDSENNVQLQKSKTVDKMIQTEHIPTMLQTISTQNQNQSSRLQIVANSMSIFCGFCSFFVICYMLMHPNQVQIILQDTRTPWSWLW